ncbi:MAG: amidohydrolase family protein [Chloroflexi bacterium]|nr:amidohydrolase family protein [Chloroflexota bacterium]
MIIDSHTHIDEAKTFGWIDPPEVLLPLMDEAGVDKAIVMTYRDATTPDDPALTYVADGVARYPDRLIGYARIHAESPLALETLDRALRDYRMMGIKLHTVSYVGFPYFGGTLRVMHRAALYHAPVLFHSGDEPLALPGEIAEAARQCPETLVILGHMGGYFHVEAAIRVAQALPNVLLDTSAMPYPAMIRRAVEAIGAERVMYASDGPGCVPILEVEKVRLAGLSEKDEALVFSGNIQRILEGVTHDI